MRAVLACLFPAGVDRRAIARRAFAALLALCLIGPGRPLVVGVVAFTLESGRDVAVGATSSSVDRWYWPSPAATTGSPATAGPAPIAAPLPPAPTASKRTALIIGINRARGGSPLPGSVTDARNLQAALLGYGFEDRNITMLLDGAATKGRITAELDRLARRTPSDGVAVFAVATHTRRSGGSNQFLTADGLRISAGELGGALGKVRSEMWVALPTCYAGGYAVPGIVGRGRVVTFASSSTQPTYQLGKAGSYLIINMVRRAMLEGRATGSVEAAFEHARASLARSAPDRVPEMYDGVRGELVLGRMSEGTVRFYRAEARRREAAAAAQDEPPQEGQRQTIFGGEPEPSYGPGASPSPSPTPRGGWRVCGNVNYRCD